MLDAALREACIADPAGDLLDAVLCLVQAAWGWQCRRQRYGLPETVDPVEGWIVSVPAIGAQRASPVATRPDPSSAAL